MSVNEFVSEEIALKLENLLVASYTPGMNQDEVLDSLGSVVQTIAEILTSPNNEFKMAEWDVKTLFAYRVSRAAEIAYKEQCVIWDAVNGTPPCGNQDAHDAHGYSSDLVAKGRCGGVSEDAVRQRADN